MYLGESSRSLPTRQGTHVRDYGQDLKKKRNKNEKEAERRRRGSYACGEERGGNGLCGEPHQRRAHGDCQACAHARPMVARLWKKYAARRKVNALSVGSSPKSSKKLTA